MITLAFAIVAYLFGSVSTTVVVSRLVRLPDPRTYGVGEPSATNLMRSGHTAAGIAVLFIDCVKGALPVIAARAAAPYLPPWDIFTADMSTELACAAAVGVFLGHLFPIYRRLRGSNGVAVAIGAFCGIFIMVGGGVAALWFLALFISRTVAIASLAAAVALPAITDLYLGRGLPVNTAVVFMALLVWQHRSNIANLIRGTEPKIGRQMGAKPDK